jgi:hypothetical protein
MTEQKGRRERRDRGDGRDEANRLRGLVGAGPSKVGVSGALRSRDVSRPTDEDIAAAEAAPPPRVGPPASGTSRPRSGGPTPGPPNRTGQPVAEPADPSGSSGSGGNAPSDS